MDYGHSMNYGAQGAADGGGFLDGGNTSSQTGGKAGFGKETVRPVTIKQLLDAQLPHPDAEFQLDGDIITQVTFIGQIRGINKQPTNITYKLDDGTGIIEVRHWIDTNSIHEDMDVDSKSNLAEDTYCRIWGKLVRAYSNKRVVGAHVIRPITDYNEINYHLLEATAIHLFFTKGAPQPAGQNGVKRESEAGGGDSAVTGGGGHLAGVSPLARRVYKALRESPQSNEGLHVQMLASNMGIHVNEVYKGAEELVSIGVIFTTVDDQTWAVLDA